MSQLLQKIDTSAFYESDQNMVEHAWQHNLLDYLESVIRWLYYKEGWFVIGNIDIVNARISHPIAPDLMFFKGVVLTQTEIEDLSIWQIELPHRPPPTVVFEIGSKSTGKADIEQKPEIYRVLGATEYFAFDPKNYWGKRQQVRLRGWRYANEFISEIQPDAQGRLWSIELDSFVVGEGSKLHLYDANGGLRLDELEGQKASIFAKLRERGINPEDLGL
jgi:Uma2 family endonuclease